MEEREKPKLLVKTTRGVQRLPGICEGPWNRGRLLEPLSARKKLTRTMLGVGNSRWIPLNAPRGTAVYAAFRMYGGAIHMERKDRGLGPTPGVRVDCDTATAENDGLASVQ